MVEESQGSVKPTWHERQQGCRWAETMFRRRTSRAVRPWLAGRLRLQGKEERQEEEGEGEEEEGEEGQEEEVLFILEPQERWDFFQRRRSQPQGQPAWSVAQLHHARWQFLQQACPAKEQVCALWRVNLSTTGTPLSGLCRKRQIFRPLSLNFEKN